MSDCNQPEPASDCCNPIVPEQFTVTIGDQSVTCSRDELVPKLAQLVADAIADLQRLAKEMSKPRSC